MKCGAKRCPSLQPPKCRARDKFQVWLDRTSSSNYLSVRVRTTEHFGVRWQAQRDTASESKASSALRYADALHIQSPVSRAHSFIATRSPASIAGLFSSSPLRGLEGMSPPLRV